ncbi:MAG: helix-turn-helix domain-containing protein [Tagaea sp.]|nr:helix-turn-helix domain-containing protein [Tagaea sp.]
MTEVTLIVPLNTERCIGRYLGAAMKASGFTKREVARDLKVNETTLAHMMLGYRPWQIQTLDQVLDYLAVKGEAREAIKAVARLNPREKGAP